MSHNASNSTTLFMLASVVSSVNLPNLSSELEFVAKKYFYNESLLFVYWNNETVDFKDYLMKYWVKSDVVTMESCDASFEHERTIINRYITTTVVLLGQKVPEKDDIKNMIKCKSWHGRSKILIIAETNDKNLVNLIFHQMWNFTKAINVTIMLITGSSVQYYTSHPYQNFKIEKLTTENLFPNKIPGDFNGSIIHVATTATPPYILKPETPGNYEDGVEIRILKTLSEKFNFRVKYMSCPPGEDEYVFQSPDGKIIGLFGLLDRHEADVLMHGVRVRPDRSIVSDIVAIHSFDSLGWAVPSLPYVFKWKSLLLVFQIELWIAIIVTSNLVTVTVWLLTYEKNSFSDAFFYIFAKMLCSNTGFPYHDRNLFRLFMFVVSAYAVILVSLYQSSLVTFLTTPSPGDQYDSFREVVEDGLIGHFAPNGKAALNKTEHDLWNIILRPGRHVWVRDYHQTLGRIAYNKTVFTNGRKGIMEFEINENFLDENNQPMVYILPEKYGDYWIAMFTALDHPLTRLFRWTMLRLFDSGIYFHWMNYFKNKNRKFRKRGENHQGPKNLSLEHLKGAFLVYLFSTSISIISFVGEIAYYKYKHKEANEKKLRTPSIEVTPSSKKDIYQREYLFCIRSVMQSSNVLLRTPNVTWKKKSV